MERYFIKVRKTNQCFYVTLGKENNGDRTPRTFQGYDRTDNLSLRGLQKKIVSMQKAQHSDMSLKVKILGKNREIEPDKNKHHAE